jgi:hypothetical protein
MLGSGISLSHVIVLIEFQVGGCEMDSARRWRSVDSPPPYEVLEHDETHPRTKIDDINTIFVAVVIICVDGIRSIECIISSLSILNIHVTPRFDPTSSTVLSIHWKESPN